MKITEFTLCVGPIPGSCNYKEARTWESPKILQATLIAKTIRGDHECAMIVFVLFQPQSVAVCSRLHVMERP